jgi:DNA repair protein RadC
MTVRAEDSRGRSRGVGAETALDLAALHEVSRRVTREEANKRTVISSWTALLAYVRLSLQHEPREQFRVLYLDKKNQLILDEIQNRGTVDHAPVYPREVVRRALELSASAMIIVHNHPSGDPTPSRADIDMTRQVIEAARSLSLQVHDHLIVGREGVASFKQLGLM